MSIMKATANQSSSVGMAKIMAYLGVTGRNAGFRHQRLRLAADASAILLAALKVVAWYFPSPDMFRSEATDTLTVPVQQTRCDRVSIAIRLRLCPPGV
jgi:hypothetical protein